MSVAGIKFIDRVEAPFRHVKNYTVDEIQKVVHKISEELSTIEEDILTHLLNKNLGEYYHSIDTTKVIENLKNPPGKRKLTKEEEKIKTIFLKLLGEVLKIWEELDYCMRLIAVKIILIFCEAFKFLYALIPDPISGFNLKSYIRAQILNGNI